MTGTPHRHVPEIDGLRALAVILVVLYHADVPGFSNGCVGVDLFFVISGYVICSMLERVVAGGTFEFSNFYERRARRLLPALLILLVALTFVSWLTLLPSDLVTFAKGELAALSFLANLFFYRRSGYRAEQASLNPLLHLWSLGVEEQFYLVFPVIFVVTRRRLSAHLHLALPMLTLLLLVTAACSPAPALSDFYSPLSRAWELLLGASIAVSRIDRPSLGWREACAALGLAAILVFSSSLTGSATSPVFPSVVGPCIGIALILWVYEGTAVAWLLRHKGLVALGLISYSLYLWHWPALALWRYRFGREEHWYVTAGIILSSAVAATLSWYFVEAPVRSKRRLAQVRPFVGWVAAVTALLATIAVAIVLQSGAPQRFPTEVSEIDAVASHEDQASLACRNRSALDIDRGNLCQIGDTTVTPTVLLWGDSHAAAFQPVMDEALRATQLGGHSASFDSCPPLFDVASEYERRCSDAIRGLRTLIDAHRYKTVVLIANWSAYLGDDSGSQTSDHAFSFDRALTDTVVEVRRSGASVVIADPMPGAKGEVPRSLALQRAYGRASPSTLEFSKQEYLATNAQFFSATAHLNDVRRISLWKRLCSERCSVTTPDGRVLYVDWHHVAWPEARVFVPAYVEALSATQ